MTHGYCPYTTVAAVKAADKMLGPDRAWRPVDKVQAGWLERFYRPIVTELPKIPEIASNATYVPEEHVAFLKKHGWDADIPTCPPGQFLTAAVFDLLVKWKTPGTSVKIRGADGKFYPAPSWRMTSGSGRPTMARSSLASPPRPATASGCR